MYLRLTIQSMSTKNSSKIKYHLSQTTCLAIPCKIDRQFCGVLVIVLLVESHHLVPKNIQRGLTQTPQVNSRSCWTCQ